MCILRFYILLLFILNLTGCATLPEQSIEQSLAWPERAMTLAKIQNWDMKAVMAIRTTAGGEGGSANLQWQQHQQHYTLFLFGPLGAGLVKVSGQPGDVILETADGKQFHARTPELLLVQQTGWQLPVSYLYYWIRGLPAPNAPKKMQFDIYHHLTQLNQQGWTVDYLRYTAVNHVDVPSKMTLENRRLKIKIIINQWQF